MAASSSYDDILAGVRTGCHLRVAHPHVVAALTARPTNAVLGGGYCAWRFSPRRDVARCPLALEIIVYGVTASVRADAFRDVVDALIDDGGAAADVVCVASTGALLLGGGVVAPSWVLSSPSWSAPVVVVLSPYASVDEAMMRWSDVDVMDAFIIARTVGGGVTGLDVLWRNGDVAKHRVAVATGTVGEVRPDAQKWGELLALAALGYAYVLAAPDAMTLAKTCFSLRGDDPRVWQSMVRSRFEFGARLRPLDTDASLNGASVFRWAPLLAYCRSADPRMLTYTFFAVHAGGDAGVVMAHLGKTDDALDVSRPFSRARRSYFDTACLLYDDVRAHFAAVC